MAHREGAGSSDPLATEVRERLACERARLAAQGLGARSGSGRCPALLVVDMVRAFTDPESPLGADLDAVVLATAVLARAARAAGTPTIFSVPLAEDGGWNRKIPANDALLPGSRWVEIDPRLEVGPSDVVLAKTYPSCFFGTDLTTRLLSRGVDTLLIAGASTSGCVRATAVDACSLGLRTIVVGDAVGDRSPISHEVALFDLDLKYADVVGTEEAVVTLAAGAVADR